jgi:hypothetical protein
MHICPCRCVHAHIRRETCHDAHVWGTIPLHYYSYFRRPHTSNPLRSLHFWAQGSLQVRPFVVDPTPKGNGIQCFQNQRPQEHICCVKEPATRAVVVHLDRAACHLCGLSSYMHINNPRKLHSHVLYRAYTCRDE